jgi:hypothetical protein
MLEASDVNPNALQDLRWLDSRNQPARDAFGWIAVIDRNTQVRNTAPFQRTYSLAQLAKYPRLGRDLNIDYSPSSFARDYSEATSKAIAADPKCFIFKHARLLETAGLAIDVPDIEDTYPEMAFNA